MPAPRTIITRTSGSWSASRRACISSARSWWLSALRFSGRLRVRRRTCSAGSSTTSTSGAEPRAGTFPLEVALGATVP
ncbi:MAG: hypothetical protein R2704_12005 [Microthrixaceae bacterium]